MNAKSGAAQQASDEPSFMQALAQTQAEAADSASATAAAAPQEVTGIKPKSAKDEDTDPSAASLGFLSQSIAAALAGTHAPNPAAPAAAATSNDSDSTNGVSLASGSTVQNIVANLTQGTADDIKAATAVLDGQPKTDPAATATIATDTGASGVSGFQAQMSVSSHFQTNASAHTTAQAASDKIGAPVGSSGFNDEVGGKVTWMASQGVQSASLQLSPEHLGPVNVRISVQDGSATVAFNANHADTRAALEQALPRLREMFATQGLTLSDASVSQQSPRGQQQRQSIAAIGSVGGTSSSEESTSSIAAVISTRPGLVDTYA